MSDEPSPQARSAPDAAGFLLWTAGLFPIAGHDRRAVRWNASLTYSAGPWLAAIRSEPGWSSLALHGPADAESRKWSGDDVIHATSRPTDENRPACNVVELPIASRCAASLTCPLPRFLGTDGGDHANSRWAESLGQRH